MQLFDVRNSSKSIQQLLKEEIGTGFIHRKFKGEHVRFNPKFREYVGERGITYGYDDDKSAVIVVTDQSKWKFGKSSNVKSKNLTDFLDLNFETSNRYELTYNRTTEDGNDVFTLTRLDEVSENTRPINETRREALLAQLERGRATRTANRIVENNELTTVQ